MNFRRSAILVAILCLVVPFESHGQQTFSGISYQIAFPFSDTKTFTNAVSFRGVGLDYRKEVEPQTSVGISASWNVFHEVTDEMINLSELGVEGNLAADISGNQNRIINTFPFLLTAHRYFDSDDDGGVPYIGFGVGASYRKSRLEIGTVAVTENKWHFTLAPEIGFGFETGYDTYLGISVKYNYLFAAGGSTHAYIAANVTFFRY